MSTVAERWAQERAAMGELRLSDVDDAWSLKATRDDKTLPPMRRVREGMRYGPQRRTKWEQKGGNQTTNKSKGQFNTR